MAFDTRPVNEKKNCGLVIRIYLKPTHIRAATITRRDLVVYSRAANRRSVTGNRSFSISPGKNSARAARHNDVETRDHRDASFCSPTTPDASGPYIIYGMSLRNFRGSTTRRPPAQHAHTHSHTCCCCSSGVTSRNSETCVYKYIHNRRIIRLIKGRGGEAVRRGEQRGKTRYTRSPCVLVRCLAHQCSEHLPSSLHILTFLYSYYIIRRRRRTEYHCGAF